VVRKFFYVPYGVAFALLLTGCGTQINTLRTSASRNSGISGVPPSLTSLTILDSSPTNHSPLTIQWGIVVGTETGYCLLENSSNPNACVWHVGALPTTYIDISPDGAFTLTAFLKNSNGISDSVTSNSITLDRTAPVLASAVVGNADPTNNSTFSLSYGAITNLPYSEYCILENSVLPAGCTWITGALPATYVVTNVDGSKALSIWLRDLAGNISTRVTTAPIFYTSAVPTVSFSAPAAGSPINASNFTSFTVSGTCSDNGQNVVISGSASATVVCSGGAWSSALNFTAVPDGAVTLYADLTNVAGTAAVQANRSFVKDSTLPTVAIVSPAANSYINLANVASFTVTGSCSESGRTVVITGGASATVTCTAGAWTANLDFTSAAAGAVTINTNQSDAAGNAAVTATRSFIKDVVVPTVAITSPAANSVINVASMAAFTVSGTCSENGRNVVLSGDASGTVVCGAGAWSANLDFSSAPDGAVSVTANQSDAAGNPATPSSRSFMKSSVLPTVAITAPAASSYINSASVAAFSVSGTCSANGRSVVITGDASGSSVCAAGAWSLNLDFTAAPAGNVTIYADLTDAAGNNAVQASRVFVKDVIPPTVAITSPAAGSYINNANLTNWMITGTCSDTGQNVVLSGSVTSTVSCLAGAWTKTFDMTAVADGAITVNANHSDAAGNPATQSTRSFVKDTGAPVVAITAPAAASYINNANKAAWIISGTCTENGQNVVLSGSASATVSCAAGAWTKTFDMTAVADGAITIYADHSDVGGNPATQASRAFAKDTVNPTVAISSPAPGSYINSANLTNWVVTGTCSDTGQNVVLSGSVTATVTCLAGAWTKTFDMTAVADGAITVNADHSDSAGNPATQASRAFVKDTGAPVVAITSPAAASYINNANKAAWTVSGTCSENGQNVVLSGSASATVSCAAGAWTKTFDMTAVADGAVTIYADHSDLAGNPATQASRAFVKDTAAPTVAITSPAAASYINNANKAAWIISGTCSENGQNVVLSGSASATVSCAAGAWTKTFDVTAVADGAVTIYADHSDFAGNPATQASRAFVKDTAAPTVAITSPAAASYINNANKAAWVVSGTCSENGQNVVLSGSASATVSCAAGAWTKTFDMTAVADGAITIYADHSDLAGNPATQASRAFIKNTGVPTVAITSPAVNSYINNSTKAAYTVSGTCSANGQNVVLSGSASGTAVCGSGTWTINLNFTAAADGTVTVYADHADASANNAVQASRTFLKDVVLPTVAITSPVAMSNINTVNMGTFAVSGTCSENGQSVTFSGGATGSSACASGSWSALLDFTGASDGTVTLNANLSDLAGNPATTSSRNFNKDTGIPTLTIASPVANSYINSSNVAAYTVSGACSENGQNVVITGAATGTTACAGGAWSLNLDFTSASAGTVTITANHSDAAGNAANPQSINYIKDVIPATVAITSPAAASYINNSNKAAWVVSGTCSENGQNVVLSGSASATVSCAAGAWTKTFNMTGVADGAVTIYADHTDLAGNPATQASRAFVKDTANPTVAITSPAAASYINLANKAAWAVSGTCSENGQNVVLSGSASATVSCAAGAWTKTFDMTAVADGAITMYADHSDLAGNPATQASRAFVKDTGAPTVAITSPAAASYINNSNVAAWTVSGTCTENGQNVVLSGSASATVSCAAGAWTKTFDMTAVADGAVTIYADHSDLAGNPATQASRAFVKDTAAPTVAITSPAAASYINLANKAAWVISGTCSENGQNVVLSGSASATVSCAAGAWTKTFDMTAVADGAITMYADHSDLAGNPATQASRAFVKDTGAPVVAITSPAAASYINNSNKAAWTVSGTCTENGQNVVLSGSASATVSCAVGAWTKTFDMTAVADGAITIYADHSDLAGNPATQASRAFVKDTAAPTVAITSPAAASYINLANKAAWVISGTCSENGQNVVLSGSASATVSCAAGAWTKTFDMTAVADGAITMYADHSDLAGNPATQASRAFVKDTAAPTVAITSPAAASYINNSNVAAWTVSGTCTENGQNVVLSGSASATVSCAAGAWTKTFDMTAVANGAITIMRIIPT
jgi:hypothetical protein